MYKAFLIKYGEIGVKGKNRFIFEDALVRQIKFSLKDVEGEFDVRRADGRIWSGRHGHRPRCRKIHGSGNSAFSFATEERVH